MNQQRLKRATLDAVAWPRVPAGGVAPAMSPLDRAPAQLRRIGVFRARLFGDMLCATPALRALAAAWPKARLTLIGLPQAEGLAQRLASVDDFEPFPGWPHLPGLPRAHHTALRFFQRRMRSRRFDLILQLHDSGAMSNAFVAGIGARRNAGFGGGEVWTPPEDTARFIDWPGQSSEVLRLLALTDHLGLPRRGLRLDMPLSAHDHARAKALLPMECRYAVIHPGARQASRRWSACGFAAVADRLAQAGLVVVLTGSGEERALVASVAALMRHEALDLCGRTDIWVLGALLASASVLVSNDTLVALMASALGTRSAIASCGGDPGRGPPLDALRHRVLRLDGAGHAWAELLAHAALELADEEMQ